MKTINITTKKIMKRIIPIKQSYNYLIYMNILIKCGNRKIYITAKRLY